MKRFSDDPRLRISYPYDQAPKNTENQDFSETKDYLKNLSFFKPSSFSDETQEEQPYLPDSSWSFNWYFLIKIILFFLALSIVFAGGWLTYQFLMAPPSKPTVIEADNTPWRHKPENPGGISFPHQDKSIYNRLQAKDDHSIEAEPILPQIEEPIILQSAPQDSVAFEKNNVGNANTYSENNHANYFAETKTAPHAPYTNSKIVPQGYTEPDKSYPESFAPQDNHTYASNSPNIKNYPASDMPYQPQQSLAYPQEMEIHTQNTQPYTNPSYQQQTENFVSAPPSYNRSSPSAPQNRMDQQVSNDLSYTKHHEKQSFSGAQNYNHPQNAPHYTKNQAVANVDHSQNFYNTPPVNQQRQRTFENNVPPQRQENSFHENSFHEPNYQRDFSSAERNSIVPDHQQQWQHNNYQVSPYRDETLNDFVDNAVIQKAPLISPYNAPLNHTKSYSTPLSSERKKKGVLSEASYRAQLLTSFSTKDNAHRTWKQLRKDHGDLLNHLGANLLPIKTPNRIIYRLIIGPFVNEQAAAEFCDKMYNRQAPCGVVKPKNN